MAWNMEIGNTPYILHGVKPVGDPVAEVPGEEHGRGDPHGPGVDVLAQLVHGRVHVAVLHLQRVGNCLHYSETQLQLLVNLDLIYTLSMIYMG